MTSVLIDTDPGSDDAMALALATRIPECTLVGVTTVGGNATIADTTRNALAVLESLGRADVPVARGAGQRLNGEPFEHAYHVHGAGGLGIDLPPPASSPVGQDATGFITEQARRHPGLTLVALGPLTNLALALGRDHGALEGVGELVVMGGAVETPGNIRPWAEFNIWNDPQAAARVLESGLPIRLVSLDVTRQVGLTHDHVSRLQGRGPAADLVARLLTAWLERHPRQPYLLHDPLAIAAAFRPDLLEWRQATVTVETRNAARLGATTGRYGEGPVLLAHAVDTEGFLRALIGTLAQQKG